MSLEARPERIAHPSEKGRDMLGRLMPGMRLPGSAPLFRAGGQGQGFRNGTNSEAGASSATHPLRTNGTNTTMPRTGQSRVMPPIAARSARVVPPAAPTMAAPMPLMPAGPRNQPF